MKMTDLNDFLSFVFLILKRPGMFCVNKVEDLNYMITGYTFGNSNQEVAELLSHFRIFVNNDMDSISNHDWVKLIRLYSGSDSHSLKLFQDMFERFLELNDINFSSSG